MNDRPNLVVGLVVAAVVVVAVVAAVVATGRSEAEYAAGTPEATVQGYLRAVLDGDTDDIGEYLDDAGCRPRDVAAIPRPDSARAVLLGSEVSEDEATIEVEITESYSDDPFGPSEYDHVETFTLERSGGEWHLGGVPWPYYDCGVSGS